MSDKIILLDMSQLITAEAKTAAAGQAAIKGLEQAMEAHMDKVARTGGRPRDNRLACVARAAYPGTRRNKAIAFGQWMDACWDLHDKTLAEHAAGTRKLPTPEEAIAALPVLVWP